MATVKIKLRPSAVPGLAGTIFYQVTHRRIVRQITTDYKVFPEEWDTGTSMILEDCKKGAGRLGVVRTIAQKIHCDMERLDGIIAKYENGYREYSADMIVAAFQCMAEERSFFHIMRKSIIRLRQLNRTGTAKNYNAALNSFMRFRRNEDIPIDVLNCSIVEDFQTYLRMKDLTPNSISFYMRILRAAYNNAAGNGLTLDRKPFRNVFTGMEKTLKRAISICDIRRMKNLDLSLKPNLEFARDLFMFLFYCRGMSFIDAAFLRKTDIQGDVLSYHRHKTGQLLHVGMLPEIEGILDRYADMESPYLLPIITVAGIDERKQYEAALRRVNNALKIVAKMLNLKMPLTTYVARHAWASIAKLKNVPVNVISDALGHDSIATTQIYLAAIDTSTIDKVNEMIIGDL